MVFNTMQDKQYSTVVLYYIGDVELDMNFYYTIFDKTQLMGSNYATMNYGHILPCRKRPLE